VLKIHLLSLLEDNPEKCLYTRIYCFIINYIIIDIAIGKYTQITLINKYLLSLVTGCKFTQRFLKNKKNKEKTAIQEEKNVKNQLI
jgi:hypothetical protein